MKKDIQTKEDIVGLVNAFYTKVQEDELIGPFFNDVMKVDWDKHLPIMYNFWSTNLLSDGDYKGNLVQKHTEVNGEKSIEDKHFKRWVKLFHETLDERFDEKGEKSQLARTRALSIATVLEIKMRISEQ